MDELEVTLRKLARQAQQYVDCFKAQGKHQDEGLLLMAADSINEMQRYTEDVHPYFKGDALDFLGTRGMLCTSLSA